MNSPRERLPRVLGPIQGFGIVVGGVVGASIFLVPSLVATRAPYLAGILGVWIVGALVTIAGVLSLAELAAMMPEAGGGYVYIREAFGPMAAFLFAWTDALIVRAGAAATISFTFAIYFSEMIAPPAQLPRLVWQGALSLCVIASLAALNVLGTRWGANTQVAGTVLKLGALFAAVLLPLLLWHGPNYLRALPVLPPHAGVAGFFASLVPVLWAYGGWEQLGHLAEEMRDPGRNLPRTLFGGMLVVAVMYIVAVAAMHAVLPLEAVAQSHAVGADLFRALLGQSGTVFLSLVILLSAIISANGALMAGPRSCFAAARAGSAPAWIGRIHPQFQTPANAILLVSGWAAVLIVVSIAALLIGKQTRPLFDILVSYVMFGYLGFQAITVSSVPILRKKHPDWKRPFRVPLYPAIPFASFAATLFLMAVIAEASPTEALAGVAIVLSGLPVWIACKRKAPPRKEAAH